MDKDTLNKIKEAGRRIRFSAVEREGKYVGFLAQSPPHDDFPLTVIATDDRAFDSGAKAITGYALRLTTEMEVEECPGNLAIIMAWALSLEKPSPSRN